MYIDLSIDMYRRQILVHVYLYLVYVSKCKHRLRILVTFTCIGSYNLMLYYIGVVNKLSSYLSICWLCLFLGSLGSAVVFPWLPGVARGCQGSAVACVVCLSMVACGLWEITCGILGIMVSIDCPWCILIAHRDILYCSLGLSMTYGRLPMAYGGLPMASERSSMV